MRACRSVVHAQQVVRCVHVPLSSSELLSLGLPDCLETRTCVPSDLWMRVEKTQQQGGLQEINLLWGLLTGVSEDVRSIIRQVA